VFVAYMKRKTDAFQFIFETCVAKVTSGILTDESEICLSNIMIMLASGYRCGHDGSVGCS